LSAYKMYPSVALKCDSAHARYKKLVIRSECNLFTCHISFTVTEHVTFGYSICFRYKV